MEKDKHLWSRTLYFHKPGPANTQACLEAAASRAAELGLSKVVLATSSGRTAMQALEFFPPDHYQLIAVRHVWGYRAPANQDMAAEVEAKLQQRGVKIVTAAHAFGGVGRGVRNKLGSYQIDEIMAFTLRMFGHGVKVGVEIALMAADAGLVHPDEDIVTIGGTGSGADTALVVSPSYSHSCLELKVREIIAKPRRP